MNRKSLQRWLGACGLLGPILATGCAHDCASCNMGAVAPAVPKPSVTYIYSESPEVLAARGLPSGSNLVAVVDVPPPLPILPRMPESNLAVAAEREPLPTARLMAGPGAIQMMHADEQIVMYPTPVGQPQIVGDQAHQEIAHSPAPAIRRPMEPPSPVPVDMAVQHAHTRASVQNEIHKPEPFGKVQTLGSPTTTKPSRVDGPVARNSASPPPDFASGGPYGHANGYEWLRGELQHSMSKGWRLRYATVDETDTYGGSVTLIDDGRLEAFKDGQFVQVKGYLLDPDGRSIAPAYRLESIEPCR